MEKKNTFSAFANIRDHLKKVQAAFGDNYTVAYAWDGHHLTVMCHRNGLEGPFQMVFDSDDDYKMADEKIIDDFVNNSEQWFANQQNERTWPEVEK